MKIIAKDLHQDIFSKFKYFAKLYFMQGKCYKYLNEELKQQEAYKTGYKIYCQYFGPDHKLTKKCKRKYEKLSMMDNLF